MKRPGLLASAVLAAALVVPVRTPAASDAAPAVEPLTAAAVLASSARHFPAVLAGLARVDAAAGEALSARGAFDLVYGVDSQHRLSGFYDGQVVDATAERRLRPLGTRIYGGYRVSRGDFPVYEDKSFTARGGQLRVGALFSLLRGREIDPARFAERDARLAVRQASLDTLLTRVGVQQRSLAAYWRWVVAGHQLGVQEGLLALAIERAAGLEAQVRSGARARIDVIENRRNITQRRIRVAEAGRDLAVAANDLALYLRDRGGRPTTPARSRLPAFEEPDPEAFGATGEIPQALERRPELRALRVAIERARNALALKQDALDPELDLGVELAHGFGDEGEGGPSRDATDTIVGLTFRLPLDQRRGRGELAAARAELDALTHERRLARERIALEVRNILLELEAAQELLALAERDVEQTRLLARAEERRFDSGASDFFLLTLREEAVADARVAYQQALLDARIARTEYAAASLDLEWLGLGASE